MKRLSTRTLSFLLIAALGLGAAAWLLAPKSNANASANAQGAATQTAPKPAGPKPALTVAIARPVESPLPLKLMANGNIAAWQEASVGSEAHGLRLAEVLVGVGDEVRAGQVLARFAGETVAAEVAQARAGVMEAEAAAAEAAANAERARKLHPTGMMSHQQANQYLTMEQVAKAKVEAAKALLAAQQLRMKHVQVIAPDHGIISARSATVGAVVPAGTELFRLIRRGRLEWRAEVTASELGRIKPGAPATVTAANGSVLKGTVRMIGPTVDPQSRAALVYVDLAAPAADVPPAKAGMFARGEFELGASSALTVPQQAIVFRDGFSYVFRLADGNRVQQLKVQTGRRVADRVEILGGLAPDAAIVTAGAGFLNDGDLVRVAGAGNAQPAPQAAAQAASRAAPVK
ncbi:MAG TPA: efflux RND transporter periplasmic adaptor subunit [Paucimonas sp.]|nr:efflux RND transporter periplasmic adaptor subunit [Paucimonas sp.]